LAAAEQGGGRVARALIPGDRRVWSTAGVALLALSLVVLVWLAVPRPYLTGTNSVQAASVIGNLERGQRLCIPGLQVPQGTRRVRLAIGGQTDRPAALVTVTGADGRRLGGGRTPAASQPFVTELTVPATVPGNDESLGVPATVCVTALGTGLGVGGFQGLGGVAPPLRLDGRPLDDRASVAYLPAAGAKRSLLSELPQIAERAALLRPGWIGPWTYWLIFLLVLPATVYLAVRTLAVSGEPGRRLLLALAVVAVASGATWATITVPFDTPDESEHYAYVQSVAEAGRAADHAPGPRSPYSSQEQAALDALRHSSLVSNGGSKSPWFTADRTRYAARDAAALPASNGGGYAATTGAHTPVYYLFAVPAYALGSAGDALWSDWTTRLLSSLLLAVVALCGYGVVRELLPRRPDLAVMAGLLVALQPMVSFIGGSVNNDTLVNALDALMVYLVVRGLRRGPTPWLLAGLGAAAAAAPLAKGTALALLPAVAVGVIAMLVRHRGGRPWSAVAAGVGGFVVVRGLGAVVERIYPRGGSGPVAQSGGDIAGNVGDNVIHSPTAVFTYVWETLLPRLPGMQEHWLQTWPFYDIYVVRGFGSFGWYAFRFPSWVFVAIVLTVGAIVVLGLVTLWRRRAVARTVGWELLVLLLVVAGVYVGVEAAYYSSSPRPVADLPEQGRYLFPAAVAIVAFVALALTGLPRRLAAVGPTVLVAAMAVLGVAGRLVYLTGQFG
jgi:4-amino-4-deoxy-L-arabinose transferase-like glycosyltransferase